MKFLREVCPIVRCGCSSLVVHRILWWEPEKANRHISIEKIICFCTFYYQMVLKLYGLPRSIRFGTWAYYYSALKYKCVVIYAISVTDNPLEPLIFSIVWNLLFRIDWWLPSMKQVLSQLQIIPWSIYQIPFVFQKDRLKSSKTNLYRASQKKNDDLTSP